MIGEKLFIIEMLIIATIATVLAIMKENYVIAFFDATLFGVYAWNYYKLINRR